MSKKNKRSRTEIMLKREQMDKLVKERTLKWYQRLKISIKNWYCQLRIAIWYYTCRLKAQHISRVVYDLCLTHEPSWYRKIVYRNYAEGKLWKDFGDFHMVMITKCDIMDNNWVNYIDYDGNIVGDKK